MINAFFSNDPLFGVVFCLGVESCLRVWERRVARVALRGSFFIILVLLSKFNWQLCTKTHQPWPLPFPTTNKLRQEPNEGCYVLFPPHTRGVWYLIAVTSNRKHFIQLKFESAKWVRNTTLSKNHFAPQIKIPFWSRQTIFCCPLISKTFWYRWIWPRKHKGLFYSSEVFLHSRSVQPDIGPQRIALNVN